MAIHPTINDCRNYVSAHLHHETRDAPKPQKRPPSITISRQAGARGRTIGKKLETALRAAQSKNDINWTLFDKNLVAQVLEDNDLPAELEKFMPDDTIGEWEGTINELLGRHPSLWSLFEKTSATIARLARMGHCIIVGRGGNEVTRGMDNVLRVCLVGSEHDRIRQMVEIHKMTPDAAYKFVHDEDVARGHYLKKHFSAQFADPIQYDLTVNTGELDDDQVVQTLVSAVQAIV